MDLQLDLEQLRKKLENSICVDCKREAYEVKKKTKSNFFGKKKKEEEVEDPTAAFATKWVSKKLGIFMCNECAEIHKTLPGDISDVALIYDCLNDDVVIKKCNEMGNSQSNKIYEYAVPSYYIRPDNNIPVEFDNFRKQFIFDKYVELKFTEKMKDEYLGRMPEATFEAEAQMKKGKSNWTKIYLIHHHFWICIYETIKEGEPILSLEANWLTSCKPVHMPLKEKDAPQDLICFQIEYTNPEKNSKPKSIIFKCKNNEKMTLMVISLRKSMHFYSIETNLPKMYTLPEVDRISNLMIRNSVAKGVLEKKSSSRKIWNKRYFAVVGPSLYYFKSKNDTRPNGMIALHNSEVKRRSPAAVLKNNCFALICAKRTFLFATENEEDLVEWVTSLRDLQRDYPLRRKFNFVEQKGEEESGDMKEKK